MQAVLQHHYVLALGAHGKHLGDPEQVEVLLKLPILQRRGSEASPTCNLSVLPLSHAFTVMSLSQVTELEEKQARASAMEQWKQTIEALRVQHGVSQEAYAALEYLWTHPPVFHHEGVDVVVVPGQDSLQATCIRRSVREMIGGPFSVAATNEHQRRRNAQENSREALLLTDEAHIQHLRDLQQQKEQEVADKLARAQACEQKRSHDLSAKCSVALDKMKKGMNPTKNQKIALLVAEYKSHGDRSAKDVQAKKSALEKLSAPEVNEKFDEANTRLQGKWPVPEPAITTGQEPTNIDDLFAISEDEDEQSASEENEESSDDDIF